jgi:glycosyltransferase involved in cell wall biosynthesis
MRVALDARHAGRGLGIATFVGRLAAALVDLGRHEIVWLGDPALAPAGVADAIRVDRWPYPLLDGPAGRRIARRSRADVMHFTGNTGWGRSGPVPSVLTLHDLIFLTSGVRRRRLRQLVGHRYERVLIRRALPSATVLAVPSQAVADAVGQRFPHVRPARVVRPGVDPPPAPGAPPARDYVVAFAGHDPRKRTADVVAAWRAVQPLGVRLRLLAGAGLPPGLRDELQPEIATGAVEVLDHQPRPALWQILQGALALAYPSDDEGFGLPVIEGMAAGTPVLAGVAPVTREVGGDAIVPLDAGDVAGSLAREIRRLHDDAAHAAAVAGRGLARAREFTWRRTAEGYGQLYAEAAERGPR